jgi:hypothetical protein
MTYVFGCTCLCTQHCKQSRKICQEKVQSEFLNVAISYQSNFIASYDIFEEAYFLLLYFTLNKTKNNFDCR